MGYPEDDRDHAEWRERQNTELRKHLKRLANRCQRDSLTQSDRDYLFGFLLGYASRVGVDQ